MTAKPATPSQPPAGYESTISLADAAKKAGAAERIAITTHAKPDGDAFGSVVALTAALRGLGRDATGWLMPPVPANFASLKGHELVETVGPDTPPGPDPDLLIVCDTGAWSQVSPLKPTITRLLDRTLIIDHHLNGDIPAAWRHVDGKAAACCEVIARFIDQLQLLAAPGTDLLSPTACDALYVGLASDTGWFRFSNTGPQTHELAAQLIRRGVDTATLYQTLEQAERPEKLALQTRALTNLRFLADKRVAIIVLRADDFAETGALAEETERLVELPQAVASVELVVLITETPAAAGTDLGPIRLSFRSKHSPTAVDVSQLAQQFGGGGHARAAGAKVHAPLNEVIAKVEAAITAAAG